MVTNKEKSYAIILCREPCLHTKGIKISHFHFMKRFWKILSIDIEQHNWDKDTWVPLIMDKTLLNGIVQKPTEIMIKKCRKIENKEIVRLENLWKKDPSKTYDDLFEHKSETFQNDVYTKKLNLPKTCPQSAMGLQCAFCTDRPSVFCSIFYDEKSKFY